MLNKPQVQIEHMHSINGMVYSTTTAVSFIQVKYQMYQM